MPEIRHLKPESIFKVKGCKAVGRLLKKGQGAAYVEYGEMIEGEFKRGYDYQHISLATEVETVKGGRRGDH